MVLHVALGGVHRVACLLWPHSPGLSTGKPDFHHTPQHVAKHRLKRRPVCCCRQQGSAARSGSWSLPRCRWTSGGAPGILSMRSDTSRPIPLDMVIPQVLGRSLPTFLGDIERMCDAESAAQAPPERRSPIARTAPPHVAVFAGAGQRHWVLVNASTTSGRADDGNHVGSWCSTHMHKRHRLSRAPLVSPKKAPEGPPSEAPQRRPSAAHQRHISGAPVAPQRGAPARRLGEQRPGESEREREADRDRSRPIQTDRDR